MSLPEEPLHNVQVRSMLPLVWGKDDNWLWRQDRVRMRTGWRQDRHRDSPGCPDWVGRQPTQAELLGTHWLCHCANIILCQELWPMRPYYPPWGNGQEFFLISRKFSFFYIWNGCCVMTSWKTAQPAVRVSQDLISSVTLHSTDSTPYFYFDHPQPRTEHWACQPCRDINVTTSDTCGTR